MLTRPVPLRTLAPAATFASTILVCAPFANAAPHDPPELELIGTLGYGIAHTRGIDEPLASARFGLRGVGWLTDHFGVGLEGGGFAHGFNVAKSNIACGAPDAPCPDYGDRKGGWVAPLALLSTRLSSVRPYAGASLGLAWASRTGGTGRTSWMSPAVALLGGVSADVSRLTLNFDARGDAIDDVVDATAEVGLGVNF
jgi:hypothetical protein